jgi:hypothetical protein
MITPGNMIFAMAGALIGLWIGAALMDGRWRRLRAKYYWLRTPRPARHCGEK